MSLTSYRAAPPRVTDGLLCSARSVFCDVHSDVVGLDCGLLHPRVIDVGCNLSPAWGVVVMRKRALCGPFCGRCGPFDCEWVFFAPASMPGDVLLFQRLSVSTIGAARFHGRVRDGIGWVTGAMVTKQWSWRKGNRWIRASLCGWMIVHHRPASRAVIDGGILRFPKKRCFSGGPFKHEQSY